MVLNTILFLKAIIRQCDIVIVHTCYNGTGSEKHKVDGDDFSCVKHSHGLIEKPGMTEVEK